MNRRGSHSPDNAEFRQSFVVLQRTVKKCTKIYNARAQPLYCSLNLSLAAFSCPCRCGFLKHPNCPKPPATKALSKLIRFQTKTELFSSVFKKICVHTCRFRVVFARPHYNAVSVWKRCYTLSAHGQVSSTHAHFNISAREIGAKLKLHGSACPPFWILTVVIV